jgi:hypothetical protein
VREETEEREREMEIEKERWRERESAGIISLYIKNLRDRSTIFFELSRTRLLGSCSHLDQRSKAVFFPCPTSYM